MKQSPLLLSLALAACGSASKPGLLTLVESVPSGTNMGLDELPKTADVWVEMLEEAERSIDLSHFYASNQEGNSLDRVIAALEGAGDRGVAVRFLCDTRFEDLYPELLARFDEDPDIDVRLLDLGPVTKGVQHAKYMVVDEDELFLGSPNFDWRALDHILELGVRVREERLARALEAVFELDWSIAGGELRPLSKLAPAHVELSLDETQVSGGSDSRVMASPAFSPTGLLPDSSTWDLPKLVGLIDGAKKDIGLQALTIDLERSGERFEELEGALLKAAERGVQVRLLVANWSLRRGVVEGLQELTARENIAVRFVEVPESADGFVPFARVVHSKLAVVDGARGWIGTSNIERSYFYGSRNVGLILEGEAIGQLLTKRFDRTWNHEFSKELDPKGSYEAPRRE